MPELEIAIGGRYFEVACQDGEEHFLQAAARLLDIEATTLTEQMGRLPEARMLLMAGLMLADKTAGLDDHVKELREKLSAQETLIAELRSQAEAAPATPTQEHDGEAAAPAISPETVERFDRLTRKSEALADLIEKIAEPG